MVANYELVSDYLETNLQTRHKLDTFILYFLKRVVLINLEVEQTDVPMVFEVINDRGERLKPYEILKGKLLGQIHKNEVDESNEIWENKIKSLQIGDKDLVDTFFRTYLKARFATTRAEGRKFDGDYHKIIFTDEFNRNLNLKRNPQGVKNFIKKEFSYYIDLYKKILNYSSEHFDKQPYVYFNDLTEQDNQIMLILASCNLNDSQEEEKIFKVSKLLDKTFVLLRLNKSYDSNKFGDLAYKLNGLLINSKIEDYENIFNSVLVNQINEQRSANIDSPYQYSYFKEVGHQDLNKTFLRYFFARVEFYLSKSIKLEMQNTFENYVRNTGPVNGYHIEHILSKNQENLTNFNNDEELFEKERNRLGGLLLLKGKDNQSSNNEIYSEKLKTYVNTNYWNQTLLKDFYKSKLDFTDFINRSKLPFEPIDKFDGLALESRSKLLFEIVKKIWD